MLSSRALRGGAGCGGGVAHDADSSFRDLDFRFGIDKDTHGDYVHHGVKDGDGLRRKFNFHGQIAINLIELNIIVIT